MPLWHLGEIEKFKMAAKMAAANEKKTTK